jgi:hypothetical protein
MSAVSMKIVGISGEADLLRVENTAHGKEYLVEIRNREYWFNEQRIDTQKGKQ